MSVFKEKIPFLLASNSPRRQQFFQELGLAFSVLLPTSFKEEIDLELSPTENALLLAKGKAKTVLEEHNLLEKNEKSLLISADTIVVLDDETEHAKILGKPKDHDEAFRMVKELNGRKHTVITSVCIFLINENKAEEFLFYDKTDVYFASWDDATLKAYANSSEGLDKAGAYAIQGFGTFLVEKIEGSYSTVVGFPVHLFVDFLLKQDLITKR